MLKPLLLVAGGLLLLTVGVYLYLYLADLRSLPPPQELAAQALQPAALEVREKAVLDLARSGKGSEVHLRRVLAEADVPQVRAAAIDGLGARRDWESMPQLLNALSDQSPQVRGRAGVAVTQMIGMDFFYRPDDPPEKRAAAIQNMRATYEAMRHAPPPIYRGN